MVSTKTERIKRAENLIYNLVGNEAYFRISYGSSKKPPTLPKGMNYTNGEWIHIHEAANACKCARDVSIQTLFELDSIADKYRDFLFLAKLEM
jgi:hypothetical protein